MSEYIPQNVKVILSSTPVPLWLPVLFDMNIN